MATEDGRPQILRDLEAGTISAEEANARLAAIETPPAEEAPAGEAPAAADRLADEDLPHVSDYRGSWQLPFVISLGGLALAASKLADRGKGGRSARGPFAPLRRGFYGLIFIVSGLVALLAAWSRNARWLLILIDLQDGKRLRFSLPVPVHLLGRLLSALRPFVGRQDARQLDAVVEFIESMQEQMESPDGQPIIFDITEDNERIRMYFM